VNFGIIKESSITVRKNATSKSEMINQLLFGETFKILKKKNKWSLISSFLDNYSGWIENINIQSISEKDFEILNKNMFFSNSDLELINPKNRYPQIIPTGSQISSCVFLNYKLNIIQNKELIDPLEFINTPYLWGGKTKYGIDCSGLTQVIMRTKKRFIPRDAKDQANFGETVKFDMIKKNDLCFFGKNIQNITHVGLYIGKNKLLHAFEKVRIDKINKKGIFNSDSLKITHNLISIRRIN